MDLKGAIPLPLLLTLFRILSKFIPSGSMVYGDDVFEYLYDVCRESDEEACSTLICSSYMSRGHEQIYFTRLSLILVQSLKISLGSLKKYQRLLKLAGLRSIVKIIILRS